MSEREMSPEHTLFIFARTRDEAGVPFTEIERELLARGTTPEMVAQLLLRLWAAKVEEVRSDGMGKMTTGGLVCALGIGLTVVYYNDATEAGSGSFLVAWRPIIIGGIRFMRGLIRMGEPKSEESGTSTTAESKPEARERLLNALGNSTMAGAGHTISHH